MNIYEKLNGLRKDFLKAGMKKSGRNAHAQFTYFQLEDILPIANELFDKYKVCFIISGNSLKMGEIDTMSGTLVNIEKPEETIRIMLPFERISDPAKFRMNEVQSLGASTTYLRRFLYFTLFNIIESDQIEELTPKEESKPEVKLPTAPKKSAPKTETERKEIKAEITDADGQADEMLLTALKNACKELLSLDESQKKVITTISLNTKKFTECKKSDCEKLVREIGKQIDKLKEGNN